jgi:hypothetical protein
LRRVEVQVARDLNGERSKDHPRHEAEVEIKKGGKKRWQVA